MTRHDRCKALFEPDCYQQAWNEVPVQYLDGNHMVHGIIDRLLVSDGEVTIIDYKTHQLADRRSLDELAENYRTQMRYYNAAVTRLWPNHTVRAALLFTAGPELVWLDGLQSAVKTD